MKKLKLSIATLSLLLVFTTLLMPTQALADPPIQGQSNPQQPLPQPPPRDIWWWLSLIPPLIP